MLIIPISYCHAQAPSSLELINNAKQYDGKIVTYKGEVIGDVMIRGEYVWLHVNDGIIAIGIWAPKTMTKDIRYAGDYHKKGDIVEVTGMFHRSCLEHGGDLDIHAQSIDEISFGNKILHTVSRRKINLALGLFLALILVSLIRVVISARSHPPHQN
jgi:hypothetical protein